MVDDWDKYWNMQKIGNEKIYSVIAELFRKKIIQPYLTKFIQKHFTIGRTLLHAGCGGGQVDLGVTNDYQIIPMDISINGLMLYMLFHPNCFHPIQCDIRKIGLNDESVDGVFSLGVLEHFPELDIIIILREFYRIIKLNGKLILFWPPKFGVSVQFLNSWHFILHTIFHKNQRLHPDEISLLQNRSQIENWANQTKFRLVEYRFGFNDMFTQVVIVLQKEQ